MNENQGRRYEAAMHKIQSAIAYALANGDEMASPKHLRVGVNSAMASDKAVAAILIEKGICTREEYVAAVVKAAEEEAQQTEALIRERLGLPGSITFV